MKKSIKSEAVPLALPTVVENETAPVEDTAADPPAAGKNPVDLAMKLVMTDFELSYTRDKKAYAVDRTTANPTTYRADSPGFASEIRRRVHSVFPGLVLKSDQLGDITSQLAALAELKGSMAEVCLRVAQTKRGIEIDIGDDTQARIVVEPGKVEVLTEGSPTLFERNPNFLPFTRPAEHGDIQKLLRYLNLTEEEQWLLIAWITYTLAHPKVRSSNYVILVLRGERGSGKSTMCNITLGSLLGPSTIGVQAFPGSQVDLAIAVQNSHVAMYDNLRKLTPSQADNLCRCSTSAAVSTRLLYTNGQEYTHTLHGALVLNGIHSFIDQADLAQRCLTLTLQTLSPDVRTTEKQLREDFQRDLPEIYRGVLDLIANILTHLPDVTAMYPERMLEFVHWLAAMEKARELPEGQLQKSYRDNLIGAMQDTLQDNTLADAVIQFAQQQGSTAWTGTPTDLLLKLGLLVPRQLLTTSDWPQNEIALSMRLNKLKSQLSGAGVEVRLTRGKQRQISIWYSGKSS